MLDLLTHVIYIWFGSRDIKKRDKGDYCAKSTQSRALI